MHDLPLITTIAAAFGAAWVLGLITQKMRLSPIVGYLLAGIVIGPYSPGFVGDVNLANQLAEIGVILLMFGVGLHFHLKDLLAVKGIAIPGAIVQSAFATLAAMVIFHFFGWKLSAGLVIGMAMAVASTVVLLRVLMDHDTLNTPQGHVAVGWLIVEDIFTVIVLVLVPVMAAGGLHPSDQGVGWGGGTGALVASGTGAPHAGAGDPGGLSGLAALGWAIVKLAALVVIVLLAGSRIVPWILVQVARLRSRELFTLTVLVMSIAVAVGSSALFGASVALGAFLAGMVVGQSPVSHQAASDVLPMRDAFAVLFFVSVGMIFDPVFVMREPLMVAAGLVIVLLVKPLAALAIVALLGYSVRTALTVAIGLAQIGEFSFILSQVARDHGMMPPEGHHVLVATAMISITLNPLLFASLPAIERWLQRRPRWWAVLNSRANRQLERTNAAAHEQIAGADKPLAVIVGYGPVGRVVDALLRDTGLETVIVDLNMDTIQSLSSHGRIAIYGDASRMDILEEAGIKRAAYLVITLPHLSIRAPLVLAARQLNPQVEVIVRARYLSEREALDRVGATTVIFEEGEAGIALARQVMRRRGVSDATSEKLLRALRRMWAMQD
jgi:CPA2 family monovalent cation:H+ antiporter-2